MLKSCHQCERFGIIITCDCLKQLRIKSSEPIHLPFRFCCDWFFDQCVVNIWLSECVPLQEVFDVDELLGPSDASKEAAEAIDTGGTATGCAAEVS